MSSFLSVLNLKFVRKAYTQCVYVTRLEEYFGISFVLIRLIGEMPSVGLVLAWIKSCVLRLVFLDSSLQSPGQEKHFGILFIPLHVIIHEIQLSVQTCPKI